jgi:DNA-binding winged helix-turn-helix (wHTH) protein
MLRFEDFQLDIEGGELRRRDARVALQPQPFKVLALVATQAGRLVTREGRPG